MNYVIRYKEMELLNRLAGPEHQMVEPVVEIPNDALAVDEGAAQIVQKFNGSALKFAEVGMKPERLTNDAVPFFRADPGDTFYVYELVTDENLPVDEVSVVFMEKGWVEELGICLSWRKVTVRETHHEKPAG